MRDSCVGRRVLVAGSTGYIGRVLVRELVARSYQVVGLVRRPPADALVRQCLEGAELRVCDVCDPDSLAERGFRGESFDVVISCIASRTGTPQDAWRVDHDANQYLLAAARGIDAHFVLLSAICVQKPQLAFQQAKLAFERSLVDSGLNYSIVRPTAYFKSLGGQVERVKRGKPFVLFGDGELTACKPISARDLARYILRCITDRDKRDQVLAVGGPGPALTPPTAGGDPVRADRAFTPVPPRAVMADGSNHRMPGSDGPFPSETPRQRGICTDRPLLRQRVDVELGRGLGALRRGRHSGVRRRHPEGFLPTRPG